MNDQKYLDEDWYQKTRKKLNITSTILLCVGAILVICSIILQMVIVNFEVSMLAGLLFAPGFIMLFSGIILKYTAHERKISAFTFQQKMPLIKESFEKMTPVAKESTEKMAPSIGVVAKEVAHGVKEGLKEDERQEKSS